VRKRLLTIAVPCLGNSPAPTPSSPLEAARPASQPTLSTQFVTLRFQEEQ